MKINEHDKKEIKGCILLKDKVIIEEQEQEIERLNKIINTKNKRIRELNNNNKELKALLREYKYELGLQELENTTICDLD